MASKAQAAKVEEPQVVVDAHDTAAPSADASDATPDATPDEAPVLTLDTPVEITPTLALDEPEPSTLTHVVLRAFHGYGVDRVIGEVVDASTWRMAEALVDGRRLRVLTRQDPTPVPDGQGRFFIDDDALLAFIEAEVDAAVEPNFESEED